MMGRIWLEEDRGRNLEGRRGNSEEKATVNGGMERERRAVSEEADLRKAECVQ